jgi:hypothetical protein
MRNILNLAGASADTVPSSTRTIVVVCTGKSDDLPFGACSIVPPLLPLPPVRVGSMALKNTCTVALRCSSRYCPIYDVFGLEDATEGALWLLRL